MFVKKHIGKKIGSVILATLISILSTESVQTTAVINEKNIKITNEDLTNVQLLADDEIPDIISYEEVAEKGHYERVHEKEESLNSFVFENIDGTQSLYLFEYPVKYIDKSGEIQDKSIKLEENISSFVSADSDILTSFNKNLS